MRSQLYWISGGSLGPAEWHDHIPASTADNARFKTGDVRLITGQQGTEIKWVVGTPCISSLFRAMLWLLNARPPFMLRFHSVGWFEETFDDPIAVVRRMEEILARGDRYFTSRAFVHVSAPESSIMPEVLRRCLETQKPPEEYTVEAAMDETTHDFIVDKVGPKSAIGRIWGTLTSSFPCQPMSKYGNAVSEAYEKVLRDGVPHYDQVMAALRLPDNEVHWVPYHRVIFPKQRRQGLPAVAIVSEIARVEFNVL